MRQEQPTKTPPIFRTRPPTDQQLEQAAWFILEGLDQAVPRRYLLELMRVALVELERRLRKGHDDG